MNHIHLLLAAAPPTPPAARAEDSPPSIRLESLHDPQALIEQLAPYLLTYGVRVGGVLLILLGAWILSRWVRRSIERALGRAKFDLTLTKFLANLARYAILVFAVVGCLGVFGVQTASFAAVIGAAGLTIGLAMQGSLANIAAGIMLLIFRPFRVGDVILAQGQVGKVDEIELFFTRIDTLDNRRLIIPNSALFGATLENITFHPQRRADIPVGVAYDADIDATRKALEHAITLIPGVLKDPAPTVFLKGFGASSVDWEVRVWAPASDFGAVRQAAVRAIKIALDEAGISIPFPQMDVHFFPRGPLSLTPPASSDGAPPAYAMTPPSPRP